MSAGFSPVLSLDYERVISQWGQGSVFSSSDFSLDEYTAGDVFLDLDGADEFAAFGLFEFDDVAVPPTTCVPNQPLPNQFPKAPPCCPSSAYEQLPKPSNHYIDNWQCLPEMHVNKEQGCTAFFSTPSVCFSCSSEPCTVPDNMHSSATSECPAGPGTLNGLVPQPSQFMCMSLSPVAAPPQIQLETISDAMLQRRECLRRYRDKKARRMYTKMIRYRLRKINADKRPRIKGRFVKKEFQQDIAAGMDIEDHNVSGSQPGPADAYMSDDSL